jgi:hypothetical protein
MVAQLGTEHDQKIGRRVGQARRVLVVSAHTQRGFTRRAASALATRAALNGRRARLVSGATFGGRSPAAALGRRRPAAAFGGAGSAGVASAGFAAARAASDGAASAGRTVARKIGLRIELATDEPSERQQTQRKKA